MANLWLDLKGPILADTVYVDGVLAAKDVTIALPPVNLVTADFKAMGTYTAPLPGQIEAMEASITKIGIDLGLRPGGEDIGPLQRVDVQLADTEIDDLVAGRPVAHIERVGHEGMIEPATIEVVDVHARLELVGANLLDHRGILAGCRKT